MGAYDVITMSHKILRNQFQLRNQYQTLLKISNFWQLVDSLPNLVQEENHQLVRESFVNLAVPWEILMFTVLHWLSAKRKTVRLTVIPLLRIIMGKGYLLILLHFKLRKS